MQPVKALHPIAVAVLLLNAPVADAQSVEPVLVADAPGVLVLQPQVPYDAAVLAVAGEGRQVLRRVFEFHEPIVFAPVDRTGAPLEDGSYRWDLRLVGGPSSGTEDTARAVIRRSGSFVVRGGILKTSGGSTAGSPEPDLTLASEAPTLVLTDTTGGAEPFSIEVDADALSIVNQGVNDVLTIEMGVIGVFNAAPDPDVEIHISDGLPEIRLDTSTLGVWDLRALSHNFQIVDAAELFPPVVLEIDKVGSDYTLVFDGEIVSMGAMSTGSSRTLKRDLELAPRDELLDALRELPLYAWSYKKDADGVRHVGPMAEDFHALFGLGGSDQRLSAGDTSGLALIAIQALTERLEQRERELADLRSRLEALESTR